MARRNPRRAGRPVGTVLTRRRITDAAIRILTREGYEAFTMTRLARALHVTPGAIYNHASGKQQILDWVEDRLMSMIDVSAFGRLGWREASEIWARSYREVMARHHPLVTTIAGAPVGGAPETLQMYETIAAAFDRAGFDAEDVVPTIVSLESFIYGSALDLHAPVTIFDVTGHERAAPVFARAMDALGARYGPGYTGDAADAAFDAGLAALLDAAEARLARTLRDG